MSDLFEGKKSQLAMYEYTIFTRFARYYLFATYVCAPTIKLTGHKSCAGFVAVFEFLESLENLESL